MKKALLLLLIFLLPLAVFAGGKKEEAIQIEKNVMPLPPAEDGLETIIAQPWLTVSDINTTLEGPAFDRDGNLYFVSYNGRVYKVNPETKEVKIIYDDNGASMFVSCDIHKDGRLFLCDLGNGKIVAMNSDGSGRTDILSGLFGPDDIFFNKDGSFYCSLYTGQYKNSKGDAASGKIIKVSSDFKTVTTVFENYYGANGCTVSADGKYLYSTEFFSNTLIRTSFAEDGSIIDYYSSEPIYKFSGPIGPDSTCCDSKGNILQPIYGQGRIIIFDKNGIPFKNVLIKDRDKYLNTSNVAIMPGTNQAYMTCSGTGGQAIYTFEAPENGMTFYSHN